jgi:hypothetical protein
MRTIKKIFSLYVFLMLLFSCSIDKLTEYPAIRRIVNETEVDVKIEVFSDEETFSYNIIAHDSIDLKGYCFTGAENYCYLGGWNDLPYGRIYFGAEKVQKFEEPNNVNEKFINASTGPGSGEFGYVATNENGVDIYTYRITQEDYENAEDCNGSCD